MFRMTNRNKKPLSEYRRHHLQLHPVSNQINPTQTWYVGLSDMRVLFTLWIAFSFHLRFSGCQQQLQIGRESVRDHFPIIPNSIFLIWVSIQVQLINMELDLEHLYSPSRWSKRFAQPEEVGNDHLNFAENGKLHLSIKDKVLIIWSVSFFFIWILLESRRMREKWATETIWFGSKQPHESFDVYGTHLGNGKYAFG